MFFWNHLTFSPPGDWPYSNYLEWIGEREGTLVDRGFIENQFSNAEEYRKFLFQYLDSRRLPDEVQGYINDMERQARPG